VIDGDDHLATTSPDAGEFCDDADNDCDVAIDEDASPADTDENRQRKPVAPWLLVFALRGAARVQTRP
jgi:hypothetical protein